MAVATHSKRLVTLCFRKDKIQPLDGFDLGIVGRWRSRDIQVPQIWSKQEMKLSMMVYTHIPALGKAEAGEFPL